MWRGASPLIFKSAQRLLGMSTTERKDANFATVSLHDLRKIVCEVPGSQNLHQKSIDHSMCAVLRITTDFSV